MAVIDWYSKYILSWRLSNTLSTDFCVEGVEEALQKGKPEIFNTDHGSQFTARIFTDFLNRAGVKVRMDGKGRSIDNRVIEGSGEV